MVEVGGERMARAMTPLGLIQALSLRGVSPRRNQYARCTSRWTELFLPDLSSTSRSMRTR